MSIWGEGSWKDQQAHRQGFFEHHKHVRAVVPSEKLLEFRAEDGWEPLSKFLQKPVPKDKYPDLNDGNGVIKLHALLYWIPLAKVVGRVGGASSWVGDKMVLEMILESGEMNYGS